MNLDLSKLLAYTVGVIAIIIGIMILTGLLKFAVTPSVRTIAGVVVLLIGVHRLVMTRMKAVPSRREKSDE